MKRLALVLSMVCGLAASTPAAHAATAHPSYWQMMQQLGVHPSYTAYARPLRAPASPPQQAIGGVIQSSAALRIPASSIAFSQLNLSTTEDQPLSTAAADHQTLEGIYLTCLPDPTSTAFPNSPCLGITFQNLGAAGAYYEESNVQLSDGRNRWFSYLGTYYSSVSNASAAFSTALSTAGGILQAASTSCQVPVAISLPNQCAEFSFSPFSSGGYSYRAKIRVIQISNAIFEGGYFLEQNDFVTNQQAADTYLDTMSNAFLALFTQSSPTPTATVQPTTPPTVKPTVTPTPTQTPTTTPTSISYEVLARWEKSAAKPNYKQHLASAKHGTKVAVVAFINVDSAPPSEPVTLKFVVTRGSTKIWTKTDKMKLDSADPTGLYYDGYKNWKLPNTSGTYKLTVTVTMGSMSAKSSANIKAT